MTGSDQAGSARRRLDWKAAVFAGLIAGAVFMMMEMGLVAATGESPWGPPRMIAAMFMGREVLPPPAPFDLVVLMVAMMIHMVLSILLAVAFALVATRLNTWTAVALGAGFELLIYVVNFYGFNAIFPWFAMARNAISIASHLMFGAVLGLSYKLIAR